MGEVFETGQYFGELSLLGGHREKNDVCAVMESALVALNVDTFESVLGPYTALLEEHYNTAVMAKVYVEDFSLPACSSQSFFFHSPHLFDACTAQEPAFFFFFPYGFVSFSSELAQSLHESIYLFVCACFFLALFLVLPSFLSDNLCRSYADRRCRN